MKETLADISFNWSHTIWKGKLWKVHGIRSVLVGAICGSRWSEERDYTTVLVSFQPKVIKILQFTANGKIGAETIFRVDLR